MPNRTPTLLLALLLLLPAAALSMPTAASHAGEAHAAIIHSKIRTFDHVDLAVTFFIPEGSNESPVPFVLMTHGWGGSRVKTLDGRVADLVNAGYGVLTWDSRGFGQSGGEVMLNSPDYEVRDVKVLIDALSRYSFVAKVNGDPVIGMSGGSYAGGIQLLAAAFDPRIDVIAPEITWNNLAEALAPNGVPKTYWTTLLLGYGAATSCSDGYSLRTLNAWCQTPLLSKWYAEVQATNTLPEHVRQELLKRSPSTYIQNVDVPTLLVQGFPDTLFDVNQAIANHDGIRANNAPVKLWLYDGGHAGPNSQAHLISQVVVNWFDCHLALVSDCTRVGAPVDYYGGDGRWHSAPAWPIPQDQYVKRVNGVPPLLQGPAPTGSPGEAIIPLDTTGISRLHVGPAQVRFNISSNAPEAFLFAGLGIRENGKVTVADAQLHPVRVDIPFSTTANVHLELTHTSAHSGPGKELVLVLRTADAYHANNRLPTFVYLENLDIAWPSLDV